MTSKQCYRAIKKHNISLIFDRHMKLWYAGDCYHSEHDTFEIETRHSGSRHVGHTPELAVEDYCNAHNLEWEDA